jgi:hypothetical protein
MSTMDAEFFSRVVHGAICLGCPPSTPSQGAYTLVYFPFPVPSSALVKGAPYLAFQ